MSGTPESDSVRHSMGLPEMVEHRQRLSNELFTRQQLEGAILLGCLLAREPTADEMKEIVDIVSATSPPEEK